MIDPHYRGIESQADAMDDLRVPAVGTVRWRTKHGELVDPAKMSDEHVRNAARMAVRRGKSGPRARSILWEYEIRFGPDDLIKGALLEGR